MRGRPLARDGQPGRREDLGGGTRHDGATSLRPFSTTEPHRHTALNEQRVHGGEFEFPRRPVLWWRRSHPLRSSSSQRMRAEIVITGKRIMPVAERSTAMRTGTKRPSRTARMAHTPSTSAAEVMINWAQWPHESSVGCCRGHEQHEWPALYLHACQQAAGMRVAPHVGTAACSLPPWLAGRTADAATEYSTQPCSRKSFCGTRRNRKHCQDRQKSQHHQRVWDLVPRAQFRLTPFCSGWYICSPEQGFHAAELLGDC